MSNPTPIMKREYARIRRITGSAPFTSEKITIGDLLTYNTVMLIQEETTMDSAEAHRVLNALVPNLAEYTLITYSQAERKSAGRELDRFKKDCKCYAELQIATKPGRMEVYRFLDDLTTEHLPDQPRIIEAWYETPENVVLGDQPAFVSTGQYEDMTAVDREV